MDRRLDITIGDMEHFESYITEWDIENIKNMGFDHVRVGFDQIVLESAPYIYRENIFSLLCDFVSWCKKRSLGIVLNLHKAIGNYCDIEEKITLFDSEELKSRFIALWLELEKTFHDEKDVMFELLNEVRDIDPELWNSLAEDTVKAIRELNSERKIIIGSTCWNSPDTLDRLRIFDDENVIYTFHNYAPFEFTHQRGVLQACTLYYNRKMVYPDSIDKYRDYCKVVWNNDNAYAEFERMDKSYLYEALKGAIKFVSDHPDKILWCGEFGTIRHADIKSRENWMRDMISILNEYDIPYSVWNYLSTPNDGNRFSRTDDDTRKMLSSELLKITAGKK